MDDKINNLIKALQEDSDSLDSSLFLDMELDDYAELFTKVLQNHKDSMPKLLTSVVVQEKIYDCLVRMMNTYQYPCAYELIVNCEAVSMRDEHQDRLRPLYSTLIALGNLTSHPSGLDSEHDEFIRSASLETLGFFCWAIMEKKFQRKSVKVLEDSLSGSSPSIDNNRKKELISKAYRNKWSLLAKYLIKNAIVDGCEHDEILMSAALACDIDSMNFLIDEGRVNQLAINTTFYALTCYVDLSQINSQHYLPVALLLAKKLELKSFVCCFLTVLRNISQETQLSEHLLALEFLVSRCLDMIRSISFEKKVIALSYLKHPSVINVYRILVEILESDISMQNTEGRRAGLAFIVSTFLHNESSVMSLRTFKTFLLEINRYFPFSHFCLSLRALRLHCSERHTQSNDNMFCQVLTHDEACLILKKRIQEEKPDNLTKVRYAGLCFNSGFYEILPVLISTHLNEIEFVKYLSKIAETLPLREFVEFFNNTKNIFPKGVILSVFQDLYFQEISTRKLFYIEENREQRSPPRKVDMRIFKVFISAMFKDGLTDKFTEIIKKLTSLNRFKAEERDFRDTEICEKIFRACPKKHLRKAFQIYLGSILETMSKLSITYNSIVEREVVEAKAKAKAKLDDIKDSICLQFAHVYSILKGRKINVDKVFKAEINKKSEFEDEEQLFSRKEHIATLLKGYTRPLVLSGNLANSEKFPGLYLPLYIMDFITGGRRNPEPLAGFTTSVERYMMERAIPRTGHNVGSGTKKALQDGRGGHTMITRAKARELTESDSESVTRSGCRYS